MSTLKVDTIQSSTGASPVTINDTLNVAGNTAVTGTLSATSVTTITGNNDITSIGGQAHFIVKAGDTNNDFALASFQTSVGGTIAILGAKATTTGAYPTSVGELHVGIQNAGGTTDVAIFSPTGLAVTGTLSATGGFSTTSTASGALSISGAGANSTGAVLLRNTTASGVSPGLMFWNGDGYRHYIQESATTGGLTLTAQDGTPFNIVANTAVTGTLSATSTLTASGGGLTVGAAGLASDATVTFATNTGNWSLRNIQSNHNFAIRDVVAGADIATFASTALTLGSGVNLVMASGQGIDFSATSNGSGTTTSEVLSDYEEGTWTPVVSGTSTTGAATYITQTGQYTKIGNLVRVRFQLTWSAHTGTGNTVITGLPFNSIAGGAFLYPIVADTLTITNAMPVGEVASASSTMQVYTQGTSGGALGSLALDTAASFWAEFTYQV